MAANFTHLAVTDSVRKAQEHYYGNSHPVSDIDSLNALDIVELAQPVPCPAPPPTPPDYEPTQTNLMSAPLGMNVLGVWSNFNNLDSGIKIADLEYSFNALQGVVRP